VDPLVTAHDGAAAQHGADHLGGKVLGGATQEPGGVDELGPLAQVLLEGADRDTCADHQSVGADPACAVPDRAELPASQTRTQTYDWPARVTMHSHLHP
jgi:hypothetical protein